jgi:proteasome beta subunit
MANNELKTGTTTIGIVYKDGVVMATEHRATMGNIIAHKDVQKLFKVDDNLGLTVAGLVGDAQVLVRYVRAEVELYKLKKGSHMSVKSAATLLSNIMRGGGGSYGFYYVGLILGGIDTEGGHVYSLDSAGGSIRDDYVSTGSGSPYAYGVLEDHYVPDMEEQDAVDLAVRGLNAAMRRDSASGDGYAVAVINKDGFRELTAEETLARAQAIGLRVGYVLQK